MNHSDVNYVHNTTGSNVQYRSSISRPFFSCNSIDRESARRIAAKIFEIYDVNKTGYLSESSAKLMITDSYKLLGKNATVSNQESTNYLNIHDKNKDGKVTLHDMEEICINYLCGTGPSINLTLINRQKEHSSNYHNISHPNTSPAGRSVNVERSVTKPAHTKKAQLIRQLTDELGDDAVQQELKHAKTIFEKYDIDKDGFLDHSEVEPMMRDTYKNLGQYFNPSKDDVQHYISMMDVAGNDRVSQEEYETFV